MLGTIVNLLKTLFNIVDNLVSGIVSFIATALNSVSFLSTVLAYFPSVILVGCTAMITISIIKLVIHRE